MPPMPPGSLVAFVRLSVARRDFAALSRRLRADGPSPLVGAWNRLKPLERLAAFKLLPRRGAAEAFKALDADGRWLAYLGSGRESVAPLLEGAAPSAARRLRVPSISEQTSMRRALAR